MPSDRPTPASSSHRPNMLRELFGDARDGDRTKTPGRRRRAPGAPSEREPSSEEQRENLTFALATRAVEALEDLALNVAAIRQRLERTSPRAPRRRRDRRVTQSGRPIS